jgi:hypothetical protein
VRFFLAKFFIKFYYYIKGGKMAKTKLGKKIVEAHAHKRRCGNCKTKKVVKVREYRRSTPN